MFMSICYVLWALPETFYENKEVLMIEELVWRTRNDRVNPWLL